ncbi:MAG: sigma-70 family RNA polymerase sigma factor [Lentisphaeraceae bacterium]|nr:sigma-70 family RNA polymerase sigma factor [Lentisphaeraceae bacterium]
MANEKYVTRQTLLLRAKDSQDVDAWEEFILFYRPFICQILHKMNIQFSDFDDLVQDVLVKLWKGLAKYDTEKSKFRTWLSHVTRNTVISYFRAKSSRPSLGSSEEIEKQSKLISYSESDLEKIFEDEWRAYLCNLALEKVQKLFTGHAVEAFKLSQKGKSPGEIANDLNLSKDSVPVLTSRVRKCFTAELKKLVVNLEF